jgi:two-component system sensor histidine kinase/response regulator
MKAETSAKLWIVDDDAGYASVLVDCFAGLNFDVVFMDSGEKALQEIERSRPDLILLDIKMPLIDGFQVCHRIRSHPEYDGVIIMMLTAVGEVEDKIKAIEIGANDYVVKPSGLSQLFEVIARVNRFLDTKRGYLQKMEEEKFGALKGTTNTLCHEINNPLTAIFGSARILAQRLAETEAFSDLQKETSNILDAAQRIRTITQQLARAIRVVTTEPVPGVTMIDLDASAKEE